MKSAILFQNQLLHLAGKWDSQNKDCGFSAGSWGKRILRWEREGREIITWPEDADWSRVLKVRGGNPVLFPFIARHFVDGKNEFWRDAEGTVRSMPQHGFVRDARFSVIEGEPENSLRMRSVDSEMTRTYYPFAFQFDVVVSLMPSSRLEVRFETSNPGDKPLPYYAGHHFFLPVPHDERADWILHLPCESWGRQAPDGSIVHEKAASELLSLNDSTLIDRFQIKLRDSKITLKNEKRGQKLIFDLAPSETVPWYAVTTWTEKPDSDFYCIEPWLGLPNAIHHGEGLRWLAPGQMEIAACVLDGSGW